MHKNLCAMGCVYSTVNVQWAFLGQVLRDVKQAAVAAITAQRLAAGLAKPTATSAQSS